MKAKRAVLISAGGVVALYLAYVVVAFWVLQGDHLRTWSRKSPRFRIAVESGRSFWPGRVHLEGAELVVQDHNMTMQIVAQEVDLIASVWDAFHGVVHVERAVVHGGKVRMRHRVEDEEGARERIAAFPSIPGFERPVEYPDKRPQRGKQRTVIFDEIEAHATELWFLEYRAQGDFQAKGGFSLKEDVRVDESWMTANGAAIHVGENMLAQIPEWKLKGFHLGPFPRRNAKIEEVLSHVGGQLDVQLDAVDLAPIDMYFTELPVSLTGGEARLEGEVRLDDGDLKSADLRLVQARAEAQLSQLPLSVFFEASAKSTSASTVEAELKLNRLQGDQSLTLRQASVQSTLQHQSILQWKVEQARASVEQFQTGDPTVLRELSGSSKLPLISIHESSAELSYRKKGGVFQGNTQTGVTWHFAKEKNLGLRGTLRFDCARTEEEGRPPGHRCSVFDVEATPVVIEAQSDKGTLPLSLSAQELFVASDFDTVDGTFRVGAQNPKGFANAALGNKLLAKLGVAVLPLGDWNAIFHLNRDKETFAGRLEKTQIGEVGLSGKFLSAQTLVSAWQLETPLGRYGIRQKPGATQVEPLVARDWLESSGGL